MSTVHIQIGEKYFNKDPQSTELGRNIVSESIQLLDQLGFEEFTFKKLANKIGSTEASIYRYFDNKLKLLVYLTSWYWAWMEYMIDYKTHFIEDQSQKLKETIKILCHADQSLFSMGLPGIKTSVLKRVVASESDKTYLTKKVDEINNEGLFKGFKDLCHKIALVVRGFNPDYAYPHAIVSTILEASHQQVFFAQHLPSLTEISKDSEVSIDHQVYHFIDQLIFKLLR
ncbi:TetR family transcriptional regulator [Reichenbachiella sp. 5M10]|uniref:TetR/AcrR family transcriptional regulator n=1 Tax=Reichenbachiella sp. 5M10 TaxID=1889772 RepID=UPI000C14C095|nr:TetR/AcrR family transcriptional regulator [Reichenbachiella sp. 5M10]PIB37179.1 TetR family transcriptional regulator [Reichenbachiella sp. 5M10]